MVGSKLSTSSRGCAWLANAAVLALGLSACGADDGGDGDGAGDDDTADSTGTDDAGDGNGDGDGDGDGDLHGTIALNFYPSDALVDEDLVGLAGAYHFGALEGVHDFHAATAFGLTVPPPPEGEDEVVFEGIPVPFDWGRPADWVAAGDGFAFEGDAGRLGACLFYAGASANLPMYLASDAPGFDESCAPDTTRFDFDAALVLDLFGGEAFDTEVLTGFRTPASFEVSAPSFDVVDFAVPADADLEFAWTPAPTPDDEAVEAAAMVIRIWDTNNTMISARPADDGAFAIPGSELGKLTQGPITLTMTRERHTRRDFDGGIVDVGIRYERWGYGVLE